MPLSTKRKFFKNTAIVSIFTMVSRIFGYIRDAAIFIFISNSHGALDAFFVAFRIPNFFRRIFGEGALSTAYIPVLSDYKNKKSENEAKSWISHAFVSWMHAYEQVHPRSRMHRNSIGIDANTLYIHPRTIVDR